MDCNKDEAIKAKTVAEMKMQINDFQGARTMAQKAKSLFPELDNISQLLAVCDVHCSAQYHICGTEKDWYGILQVEKLADELTIKKQYRKLALMLHPDKNKFPGAEAAFKLIGEANRVLSDIGKRSLYDTKCRVSVRTVTTKPPPHQANRSTVFRKPTQPDIPNGQQTFWTCCPFCSIKYQYYRSFVNRALRCQHCSKPFIAYDLGVQGAPAIPPRAPPSGAQGVPPGSNWGQPAFPQETQVPYQGPQNAGGFPSSHPGPKVNPSHRTVGSEQAKRTASTAEAGAGLKNKGKEAGISGNTSRKRGRKSAMESSESCDTVSTDDTEEVVIKGNGGRNSGFDGSRRRSSRQRQHVSYNENASDDDDFTSPPKRSREGKSSIDSEEEKKEAAMGNDDIKVGKSTGIPNPADVDEEKIKPKESVPPEGSSMYGNGVPAKNHVKQEGLFTMDPDSETSNDVDEPEVYSCTDPEFTDFDKDKEETCFSADQIWACYDTIDGMPRFYALVRKVSSPVFKLRITWLEADPNPEDQAEIDWVDEGLPFACGKFIRGDSEETSDRLMFSHQIRFEKGSKRNSYVVYPRTGEIWALFKNWDIKWSSDPENHKTYKFEIVEILSDFGGEAGVRVAYLEKVKGFVSLFERTNGEGITSFLIPSRELLRFSHRIPSIKMTGKERDGVPQGAFELDPASLPDSLDEFYHPDEMKMKTEEQVKHTMDSEKMRTPMKCEDYDGTKVYEREALKLRRSPRELNKDKKQDQANFSTQEATDEHLTGTKGKRHGHFTPSKGNASSCPSDDDINASPSNLSKSSSEVSEEVFYDFSGEKSEGRFQVGQIWAMYKDGLPKHYGQIKKIETHPFRLQVALLESCKLPKDAMQPACCGVFKLQNGKARIHPPCSFSHVINPKINKSKIEIYPKKGEIWALYKNWSADISSSDMEKCEYDIVEVVDDNDLCLQVSSLVRVTRFKSVFKVPRRQRSDLGILEIPKVEVARFSHQIPAFQLTGENDGRLRGYWELDPSSVPGNLFRVK